MRKLARLLALALVVAVLMATVLTVPASAQLQRVTVQLPDGSLDVLILDLPEGITLADLANEPAVTGTPISVEPVEPEAPADEPPQAEPPAAEPPAVEQPLPGETPAAPAPAPGEDPIDGAAPPADGSPPDAVSLGDEPGSGRSRHGDRNRELFAQVDGGDGSALRARRRGRRAPLRELDGTPTPSNPGFTEVLPGPSRAIGVPNFIIEKFHVPPFLLPIYQAAGVEYGVRWEILAAINEIESDYGRNLNVSSAGAMGWMQFLPSTWRTYGVDANSDGKKDPYNPVDAIFAAARYLRAAGYEDDVRGAIFAYNHADWYVDSVLLRARLIAGVPADLIGSLTGLTEARFPVRGRVRYADDIAERQFLKRVSSGENAANVIESDLNRRSIDIFTGERAPVIAVNDGVIERVARSRRVGLHVVLRDVYGNRYKYARLASTSARSQVGARVRGGVVLGQVGATVASTAPHVEFSIRPAGRGAPRIDPKPILDGWKLLEATSIYRANGENVLRSGETIGQILLLSKAQLQRRVLADDRIEIYECGRDDIGAGQIDRRILATLAYLSESGLSPSVSSLRCGHSYHTKSGNVSEHSSGNAVDISRVNGIPVLGHQEVGGITDQTVRRLMQLQGAFAPHQVISLFSMGGPTLAMADHADHIHVGFRPAGVGASGRSEPVLKPDQWPQLMDRLRELRNPIVRPGTQAP